MFIVNILCDAYLCRKNVWQKRDKNQCAKKKMRITMLKKYFSIYNYEIKFIPFGNGTQKYANNNTFEPQKGCNYEQYMLKTL